MRKILVRLFISFAIAAGLVYWLLSQGFDVLPSIRTISSVTNSLSVRGEVPQQHRSDWRDTMSNQPMPEARKGETEFVILSEPDSKELRRQTPLWNQSRTIGRRTRKNPSRMSPIPARRSS